MSLNIWNGLNVGLSYDEDETSSEFQISLDHDEVKGEVTIEFKTLLNEELNESFDTAEDSDAVVEVVIPEYEGIKKYLGECIEMVNQKLAEARGFIAESN